MVGHDYAQAGAYFVTLVTEGRVNQFGAIQDGEIRLNAVGQMEQREWQGLSTRFPGLVIDTFIIMPNHLHALLIWVGNDRAQDNHSQRCMEAGSLGAIIRTFKSASTMRFHQMRDGGPGALWQRNYYDHIPRGQAELDDICAYIVANPVQWELDHENPDRVIK